MYVPASFNVEDPPQIEAFLRAHDFATLVSPTAAGLMTTHVPLLPRRGPAGLVLVGHVARANRHWEAMNGASDDLAIFLGPHAYVSPSWYATSPAVPTWNYAAVHAHGRARAIHDPTFTRDVLIELVRRHEGDTGLLDALPPDYIESMLAAIVAFELPVERLEAKFKLGQNRSVEDRAGTIAGLERDASPEAAALAAFMRRHAGTP
jgi:transcriptional regulator